MTRRITTLILLVSMLAYGGGIARALHHVTAHQGDHSHCHFAEPTAASKTSGSCCGHSHSHAEFVGAAHPEHGDDDSDTPADDLPHDHDCSTCDMLMSIAASTTQPIHCAFAHLPANDQPLAVTPAARIVRAFSHGGPRAPPFSVL